MSFWNYTFNDPVTPIMWGIISLHDHVMFFLILILIVVLMVLFRMLEYFDFSNMYSQVLLSDEHIAFPSLSMVKLMSTSLLKSRAKRKYFFEDMYASLPSMNPFVSAIKTKYTWSTFRHGMTLEIIWTLVPSYILLLIAMPSFALLFAIDETYDNSLVIKMLGHQWYWSYECDKMYSVDKILKFKSFFKFDSYMTSVEDLVRGELRLLKTDNALVMPQSTPLVLIITSEDVLHSWSVAPFGIKVDAVPGRLSQASLLVERMGVYFGQCSELCGVNHGFMPIEVSVIDVKTFNLLEKYLDSGSWSGADLKKW